MVEYAAGGDNTQKGADLHQDDTKYDRRGDIAGGMDQHRLPYPTTDTREAGRTIAPPRITHVDEVGNFVPAEQGTEESTANSEAGVKPRGAALNTPMAPAEYMTSPSAVGGETA